MTLEELYKLKKELLNHVVGMSYNMQEVLKIEEKIKELKYERKNKKNK